VEKSSGVRHAVKKFEKRTGPGEKSKVDGLQQEIAVLMSVSHPTLLCLKDTFDEDDGVYLVLELATEGELFNWIVMKQKLTEVEARKVFVQLFQAVKYLVRILVLSVEVPLTMPSTSETSFIETSSPKTYCLPTRI
jgi:serine/threonine-protein kinase Chk2